MYHGKTGIKIYCDSDVPDWFIEKYVFKPHRYTKAKFTCGYIDSIEDMKKFIYYINSTTAGMVFVIKRDLKVQYNTPTNNLDRHRTSLKRKCNPINRIALPSNSISLRS